MTETREPAPKYLEMRNMFLNLDPADANMVVSNSKDDVWGVMVETGMENARFSMVMLKDGNCSVYFDNGGGIIGGFKYPDVVTACKKVTHNANLFLRFMIPTQKYPLVDDGQVQFFLKTGHGDYMVDVEESVLTENEHELS